MNEIQKTYARAKALCDTLERKHRKREKSYIRRKCNRNHEERHFYCDSEGNMLNSLCEMKDDDVRESAFEECHKMHQKELKELSIAYVSLEAAEDALMDFILSIPMHYGLRAALSMVQLRQDVIRLGMRLR